MSMSDIADGLTGVAKAANKASDKVGAATTGAGVDVLGGALHAGQGVLNVLSAPQRAVAGMRNYVDEHGLEGGKILGKPDELRNAAGEAWRFATHPSTQAQTGRIDRAGSPFPSDEAINAHLSGFPATAARWGAQAGSEILADPVTYIPGGAIPKLARAIPGVGHVAEAVRDSGVGRGLSAVFNPEHHLSGLTTHGQNVVAGVTNRAEQSAAVAKRAEDLAIAKGMKEIKAGNVPASVSAAFAKYGATVPASLKPADFRKALDEARSHASHATAHGELHDLGLLPGNSTTQNAMANARLMNASLAGKPAQQLFRDPAAADAAREGVAKHLAPATGLDGPVSEAIKKSNDALKTMFLAVPIPHVGNLVNLAYNKYGAATTLRGLMYAAREATGLRGAHLNALVNDLKEAGADNQYSKLFPETSSIAAGRLGAKFFNKAQDTVLNPVERGLRASMMEVEKGQGRQGVDAARNIHKALGSDPNTGMTKFLSKLPLSQFPRFHTQTALGSFGRTAVTAPGRITGFEHVMGGPDRKPDGKPHFHVATPTAAGLSMLQNPLSFLSGPSTLGGLTDVTSAYSPIGQANAAMRAERNGQPKTARKDLTSAVQLGGQKVLPSSEALQALYEIAKHKKGRAGQTGVQDLLTSLTGGYWSAR